MARPADIPLIENQWNIIQIQSVSRPEFGTLILTYILVFLFFCFFVFLLAYMCVLALLTLSLHFPAIWLAVLANRRSARATGNATQRWQ